jgi:hypothetical protein
VIARYRGKVKRLYFRGDAAFANPEMYELLEAEAMGPSWLSAGRLRSNFVAARLDETEDRVQQPGYPGMSAYSFCYAGAAIEWQGSASVACLPVAKPNHCRSREEVMWIGRPSTHHLKRQFLFASFGIALWCGMAISDAHADQACGGLPGTYLLTVLNSHGVFTNLRILTLTQDGNAIVGSSHQGGVTDSFNPFTTAQGTWVCESSSAPIQADVTTLDFRLPGSVSGEQYIGRNDYQITFHATSQTIAGTRELRLFPLRGTLQPGGPALFPLQLQPSLSPGYA